MIAIFHEVISKNGSRIMNYFYELGWIRNPLIEESFSHYCPQYVLGNQTGFIGGKDSWQPSELKVKTLRIPYNLEIYLSYMLDPTIRLSYPIITCEKINEGHSSCLVRVGIIWEWCGFKTLDLPFGCHGVFFTKRT